MEERDELVSTKESVEISWRQWIYDFDKAREMFSEIGLSRAEAMQVWLLGRIMSKLDTVIEILEDEDGERKY